jgi:hypothetical protein
MAIKEDPLKGLIISWRIYYEVDLFGVHINGPLRAGLTGDNDSADSALLGVNGFTRYRIVIDRRNLSVVSLFGDYTTTKPIVVDTVHEVLQKLYELCKSRMGEWLAEATAPLLREFPRRQP